MRILEQVEVGLQWSDIESMTYHERVEHKRTKGVHMSDVLRYIAIKSKMYSEEDRADDMPLRVMLGMGFEEQAVRLYKGIWWQPGEFVLDDGVGVPVYGSPDGIEEIRDEWLLHEFKYSGKSMRVKGGKAGEHVDVRTLWLYMQQIMSYINMLRLDKGLESNKGVLHVCWKYGDYSYPLTERYFRYTIEFEEKELDGNLAMLQAHKEQVAIEKGVL